MITRYSPAAFTSSHSNGLTSGRATFFENAIHENHKTEKSPTLALDGVRHFLNDLSGCRLLMLPVGENDLSVEPVKVAPELLVPAVRNDDAHDVIELKMDILPDAPLAFQVVIVAINIIQEVVEEFEVAEDVEVKEFNEALRVLRRALPLLRFPRLN